MSLVRNTLTQSSLTMSSRILGFVRDVLIAAKVGAGPIGDAFVTALMFPNLFRRIFAEGAFAQAFVPAYARTLEAEGPEAAADIARQTMRGLFAATAALVIVAQLAMPWIMKVIHGGYEETSESFQLAILLTQITMPYLACMALAALLSGVLNSSGRFILSAGAPTLLNLFLITAALLGGDNRNTAWLAAIAVSAAGVAQAGLLWWGVSRQKVSLSLGWPKLTPGVKKVIGLAVPGTIAASGVQINILVSQALASFEEGAKSWLFYADRLYQLPLGIVGVAVGVAILPRLARAARADDTKTSHTLMDDGIGLAMALTVPAAIALMVAPAYLIEGLYARGAFTLNDCQSGRIGVGALWLGRSGLCIDQSARARLFRARRYQDADAVCAVDGAAQYRARGELVLLVPIARLGWFSRSRHCDKYRRLDECGDAVFRATGARLVPSGATPHSALDFGHVGEPRHGRCAFLSAGKPAMGSRSGPIWQVRRSARVHCDWRNHLWRVGNCVWRNPTERH